MGRQDGDSQEMNSRQILHEFFANGTLTDVVLMTSAKQFSAHKVILASESGFLRARLTTGEGMAHQAQVNLESIPGDVMGVLLTYMYLRKLELTQENVRRVYQAADYLIMDAVRHLCVEYLVKTVTSETCLAYLPFAREFDISVLTEYIWKYVLKNFEAISKSTDFLSLDITDLVNLFSSDNLNVKFEETVWEALVSWYNHDPEDRQRHLSEGLRYIRLGLMDTQYFLNNVRDHPVVADSRECRPIIIQALRFFFDLDYTEPSVPVMAVELACPRYPPEILMAIGGWSGGSPTNCIEVYDNRADRWNILLQSDPEGPRAYHGTVVVGTDVYIIGGYNGSHYFSSCRCFDLKTLTWRTMPSLNQRRCYVSVVVVDSWIYAIGGYDGTARLNSGERFDVQNGIGWLPIQHMSSQRSDASATVIDGKIYVVGGFTGRECLNSAEVYDPETNQWRLLPHMESKRSGVSCLALGTCLYVFGGFNGSVRLDSCERYSPRLNIWTAIAPMLRARSNFAVASIDGNIMVIGGFNGASVTSDVEAYNPSTNTWSVSHSMTLERSALSACTISDPPGVENFIHRPQIQALEYSETAEEEGVLATPVAPPLADVPLENIAAQRSRMFFSVRHG